MKFLILVFFLTLLIINCNTNNDIDKAKAKDNKLMIKVDPCNNLVDSFFTISKFAESDQNFIRDFHDVIKFIESKNELKALFDKHENILIDTTKDIVLPHYIDTCDHKYMTQFFVLKNIRSCTCYFRAIAPLKGTKSYFPRFTFTQWFFSNNQDRDSALKIKNWVYSHGSSEYEYRFNQTIVGNKRIYLIETWAKIFEDFGKKYAKYLQKYVNEKNKNNF